MPKLVLFPRADRVSSQGAGLLLCLAVFVLLALASPSQPAPGPGERYTIAGDSLALYDLVGEVTVEGATGGDATIDVTRGGPDAARLRIERGPIGGYQTFRVIFPADHVVYPPMRASQDHLQVGDDGRFDDQALFQRDGMRGEDRRRDRHDVEISSRGPGLQAQADLRVRVPSGRTLALFLAAGNVTVTNIDGDLRVSSSSAPVTIRNTHGSIKLDTGSGELRVRDVQGNVSLDTGSGGSDVRGVRGRSLILDTGSGEANVADVEVDVLDADTGSGSVEISDARSPDIRLDTGSGSVRVNLSSGTLRSLSIDSGSGGVTLGMPRDIDASFDIESGSGGVSIQVPHTVESRASDHVRGRFGDGRGRIHIDSGSGRVRILPRWTSSSHQESGLGSLLRYSFS